MIKKIFTVGALLLAQNAAASYVATPADGNLYSGKDGYCSAVQLTYVGSPSTNALKANESYGATSCKGYTGNDPAYGTNIGSFGDGLLNGEIIQSNGFAFSSREFANWVDVNQDGKEDKPGWIGLARVDDGVKSYNTVGGVDLHPYIDKNNVNYGNIFDLSFTSANSWMSGDWRLQVNAAALLAAKNILGNSYFDHLNIVLKGGTTGFISYDFNFKTIFDTHNSLYNDNLSLLSNYTLGGTWGTYDLLQTVTTEKCEKVNTNTGKGQPVWEEVCTTTTKLVQQGLSHATFAAHDPLTPQTTDVPAPSTLALFGLSLLGLGVRRFRK